VGKGGNLQFFFPISILERMKQAVSKCWPRQRHSFFAQKLNKTTNFWSN